MSDLETFLADVVRQRDAALSKEFVGNLQALAAEEIIVRSLPRLLAIIEAQRAELEKAQAGIDRVCSADDIEAGLVFIATWRDGFGGNPAIAAKFERGEL